MIFFSQKEKNCPECDLNEATKDVGRYCDSVMARSSIKRQIFKPNAAPALFARLEIASQRLYTCSSLPLHEIYPACTYGSELCQDYAYSI